MSMNKVFDETLDITLADNGILLNSTWHDNGERSLTVALDDEKDKAVGVLLLSSVRSVADSCHCDKVRITIKYEPVANG